MSSRTFPVVLTLAILVTSAIGVALIPSGPAGWVSVSAQAAPKAAPGDRIYLKIDGVDGEATETDHGGDIALRSFSWGQIGNTDSAVKAQIKDFTAIAPLDKAAPLLMRKAVNKELIGKVTLAMRNSIGQDYLKWTMGNVIVTGFGIEGNAGQGKPLVTITLRATKIDVEYRPQLYSGGMGPAVKQSMELK